MANLKDKIAVKTYKKKLRGKKIYIDDDLTRRKQEIQKKSLK